MERDANLAGMDQDLESMAADRTVVGHTCTYGVIAPCC